MFVTVDKVMTTGASAAILCKLLETHPMYSLVQKCLMKLPSARPTIINVVDELVKKVFIFVVIVLIILVRCMFFLQNDTIDKMDLWEEDIKKKIQTLDRGEQALLSQSLAGLEPVKHLL